ncbi:MAG: acetylxylan esterase [Capsulimonadaceae bacterium]|nr:acetylxylan esterase [Capsulimonadaceae bacterium]
MDFDRYWRDVREEVAAADQDWDRQARDEVVEANGGRWRIDWVRFSSVRDSLVWGWHAVPLSPSPNGACMLWLPGYSYGTPPPDPTCLIPGASTLCINVHGLRPDEPYINPAGKNDYILQDIDNPVTYIMRSVVQHCLRALHVAAALPEVNAARIVVGGMSQGGALAIMSAANSVVPKACFADMPFLSDIETAVRSSSSPVYKAIRHRMRVAPAAADGILATLSLFDPVRHAPRVVVPTCLSAGGRDPSVKPAGVEMVFCALGTEIKHYEFYPNAGHVFLPEMNRTHTEWVARHVLEEKEI